jgi:hypothetical protein
MDPQQFDALSRTFVHASSRRQAMARAGAAGLLAGLATAFGRGRAEALPAVQGETCRLDIVATVRLGPDATERMQTQVPGELRGEISFALGPDGAIDAGRFLLDGGPEVPVVGQATGRALNLRADLRAIQEGLTLILVGTAEQPLDRCVGAVDGYLTGPLPGDLGDWHATLAAGGNGTGSAPTPSPTPPPRMTIPNEQSCGPGLTRCGSVCVDLQTDARNCSVCQLACSAGASCINGSCVCPPDRSTSCNGVCVDLNSDLNNCGACGSVCESGLVGVECRGGECVRADCAVGLEYCGAADLCRDLSSDPGHCGACGNACPSGVCSGGVCQSVPIANIPIDEAPPDEVSLCLPGLVYCGNGVCVDIYIDSFNCGGCGITCPYPQGCQGGVCVGADSPCLPGLVLCGDGMGVCVDTSVDSFNCGGCGITCQFPQGCQGGVCVG